MSREYLHVIDVADSDPVKVDKINSVGHGLQFTAGNVVTTIPWSQVTRIRRADVAELRRCADPDDPCDDLSDEVKALYEELSEDEVEALPDPDVGADGRTIVADPPPAASPEFTPTADNPEPGVVRAGVGQEQVGDDQRAAGEGDEGDEGDGKAREWPSHADDSTMRAWAKEQGLRVSETGPVSKSVASAYAAANS